MTTSGTTTFAPNLTELVEECFERAGREARSGYDFRTARRSMNLLLIEWQNRGINMWTLDQGSIDLVAGTATYVLPADTVDLLEHFIRTDAGDDTLQSDININRISVSSYANIPNKTTQARPLQIFIERLETPQVTLWPVPDDSTPYKLVYWRMRRVQDAGTGVNTPDIVYRFYPALVAGLAYYIAMKIPEGIERVDMLKAAYEEQYDLAAQEDREKASLRWTPRRQFIGRSA